MAFWLALPGLVLIGLGLLARNGRLPRNGVAGIRTQALMASKRAWRAGHYAVAPIFVLGGAASVALGIAGSSAAVLGHPLFHVLYSVELLLTVGLSIRVATRAAQAA